MLLQISEGTGGEKVTHSCKFIIGKLLKMLRFKIQQNRTTNEEFNFLGGREEERGPHY